ncbi:YbjN domain-containing protein [Miniimonas sp. S16]|uniref:YbjN domain-containing protein n=1 Tax=Miniimonas sp. S16 TaxID=2171623 RepID=UPI000D527847|nr:YbjN domain-containing protein [Miniimonas sp. S16]
MPLPPVTPVTPERLRRLVTQRGEFVREIPEGVVGQHGGRSYQLVLIESDLVLRTRWSRHLPPQARRGALQLVNDWNRDRILPTLHTQASDDGVALVAVHTTSVALGLSPAQLAELVDVTLSVTGNAMSALDGSIPLSDVMPDDDAPIDGRDEPADLGDLDEIGDLDGLDDLDMLDGEHESGDDGGQRDEPDRDGTDGYGPDELEADGYGPERGATGTADGSGPADGSSGPAASDERT